MTINAQTTIARVLKQCPEALEVIIAIHPRFSKLRNPLLRKLMAGRTTLAMAAKVGGFAVAEFYKALKPLGFEMENENPTNREAPPSMPAFMVGIEADSIVELDVRPVIDAGKDPLQMIMQQLAALSLGQTLKIINSFEPAPLVLLLEKKGYVAYVKVINDGLVATYFHKAGDSRSTNLAIPEADSTGWKEMLVRFNNHIQTIDVRSLEMPQPMVAILAALETLPAETALLVQHKRIPVFLLPELADRDFAYCLKENSDGSVNMLIYKACDNPAPR